MKFVPKPKQPNCSCCKKPYKASEMEYIGYQVTNSKGEGFPLFNCPCGTTVSGLNYKIKQEGKTCTD